jgi:hypothetical protein
VGPRTGAGLGAAIGRVPARREIGARTQLIREGDDQSEFKAEVS